MKGQSIRKQKSGSSNKSHRVERKSQSKRNTINTLSTLEEKQKQHKLKHLSKTLNFCNSTQKSKPTPIKSWHKNREGYRVASTSTRAPKSIKRPPQRDTRQESRLRNDYAAAVAKVFNVLDIFSRGTISEANISRWVPEAALYFLGSVFQKIRSCRIAMSLQQFQLECFKIFDKSADSDIRFFIQDIAKHDNFNDEKLSLEGEIKETVESYVEDRVSFLVDGQASFRQAKPSKKIMAASSRSKENAENVSKKNWDNLSRIGRQKGEASKITPLNNINSFQNVAVRQRHRKATDVQNLMGGQENGKRVNGVESPFFQGSISNVIARTVSSRRKENVGIDRIDKLSMRLEDYIKENAMRIERSKNCRVQL